MYRIITSSKDTYITNKITRSSFRVTDANVGSAGTLDLFKLYNESISGSAKPYEHSRLLIKFDLGKITQMVSDGLIDIGHSSFKTTLKLRDVYGGQTTPNNFKIISFPLSQSFDEGIGLDVINYNDLGIANYITASYSNGTVYPWNQPGGFASGTLGDENIDVIVSGNVGGGMINFSSEQYFETGEEDLNLDVTNFVSASVAGLIPNHGFLISYSGSYEKDLKSYFVKRFASRNVAKEFLRPHIAVKFDDSILDNHQNFVFNVSGSLFLNNYHRNTLSNILSGTSASQVSGDDCMLLILKSGSYEKIITASQHKVGSARKSGIYSASFAISEYDSELYSHVKRANSASFVEIWSSLDRTVGYHTGSFVVNSPFRTSFNGSTDRLLVTMTNLQSQYTKDDRPKLRVFIEDRSKPIKALKLPRENISNIYTNMYYRVVDSQTGEVIIPFDTENNSTLLSSDSDGMYFYFYMDSLYNGRTYSFDFLIKDFDNDIFINDVSGKFIVRVW